MEITINNFGPIHRQHFDLSKDLHLIFGSNNIGKSYSITVVYLIIKSFLSIDKSYLHFSLSKRYFKKIEKECKRHDIDSIKSDAMCATIIEIVSNVMNDLLVDDLRSSFYNSFSSFHNIKNKFSLEDTTIKLTYDSVCVNLIFTEEDNIIVDSSQIIRSIDIHPGKQRRSCKISAGDIKFYFRKGDFDSFVTQTIDLVFEIVLQFVRGVSSHVANIFYLPASRSGLYQALGAFSQIVAELSKSRSFLRRKIEIPALSEPVSDYFLNLSYIYGIAKKLVQGNNRFDRIASMIEDNILNGKVELDAKEKKILFVPNNTNIKLDLSAASSMVAELSPIVSYIRYVFVLLGTRYRRTDAGSKILVIIEEPEAHLHPENQVKLMQVFAELVKSEVKMIITTHSNYIFAKGNNLILDRKIEVDRLCATLFIDDKRGSIGTDIQVDHLGMDDDNFISISEGLYDEKISIIEKYNADRQN